MATWPHERDAVTRTDLGNFGEVARHLADLARGVAEEAISMGWRREDQHVSDRVRRALEPVNRSAGKVDEVAGLRHQLAAVDHEADRAVHDVVGLGPGVMVRRPTDVPR